MKYLRELKALRALVARPRQRAARRRALHGHRSAQQLQLLLHRCRARRLVVAQRARALGGKALAVELLLLLLYRGGGGVLDGLQHRADGGGDLLGADCRARRGRRGRRGRCLVRGALLA